MKTAVCTISTKSHLFKSFALLESVKQYSQADLFVVWAGLSAHKFLEKGRWFSLVSILLLFSLAMLSKKSVYPMAIVLPIATILSKELTTRQLIQIVVAFVIPAGLIGADFQWKQMILMTAIPLTLIAFTYFFKRSFLAEGKQLNIRILLASWTIPAFSVAVITFASIYLHSFWLIAFTIPFFVWLFRVNFKIGILLLSLVLIGAHSSFMLTELSLLLVLINVGYFMYILNKKGNYKQWIAPTGISILYCLVSTGSVPNAFMIGNAFFFFWLVYKKVWFGIIFSLVTTGVAFYSSKELGFYPLEIIFSLFLLFEQKAKSFLWSATVPVLAFSGLILFLSYKDYQFKSETISITQEKNEPTINSQLPKESDSFLKEGRTLLYVENTLIAPHTQSEKIATGFATLGEYMRLHLFPKEFSFYYGFAKTKTVDFSYPIVWISMFIHFLLIGIAIWLLKKRPIVAIGALWYLLSIFLFSNWVELVAGMVGDRLAFTASAGFCIFIAGILFWIKPDFNLKKPGIVGAVLGISVLLLAGRTIVRNTDWKDTLTLMSRDMKHLSNSAQANNLYAMTLMAESVSNKSLSPARKLEIQQTAIFHFDQATSIWPNFYNAYIDKARASIQTREFEKGIEAAQKAMEIDPENVLSHYLLLELTEMNGDFETYLKSAQQLFEITQSEHSYGVVARGYFLLKNYEKSKEVLLEGLKQHPDNPTLINNLKIVEAQ